MYRMHIARISSRTLVSAPPPKQSFLLFLLASTGDGCATPALSACAAGYGQTTFGRSPYSRYVTSPDPWSVASPRGSVRFFLAEFLEARIVAERIEHRIEPEKCRSKRQQNQSVVTRYRE